MSKDKLNFSVEDLENWVEKGLITPEQITNIRSYIESKGSVEEQKSPEVEQKKD